jgi:Uri superfamily endonuclease
MNNLSNRKGTYALIMFLGSGCRIRVGKLGIREFKRGYYVYAGSAFGPGGLAARLKHHVRPAVRPHWHIDYLGNVSRLKAIWYVCSDLRLEHPWASAIKTMPDAKIPVNGFGSTDCRCVSHLFCFLRQPFLPVFHAALLNSGFDQQIRQFKAFSDSNSL